MQLITPNVYYTGAIDWNRRLFDAMMPIPEGTTYNSYLIKGSSRTALLDTVEPQFCAGLMRKLESVERLDYIVIHHTEQDHSGSLPEVLKKYPEAVIVTTGKSQTLLQYWFDLPESRFQIVKDGDSLDLGGKNLTFWTTPWVHWPDTMVTYLKEERILFTCDLFGSHIAQSKLFAGNDPQVIRAAKLYFAVIMAPYRNFAAKYIERIAGLDVALIAPSHGPLHDHPAGIIEANRQWAASEPKKMALIPFITMHDSTRIMVEMLTEVLIGRGVEALPVDLTTPDVNRLAEAFLEAETIVWASPVVLTGAHPNILYAAHLANYLKPKAKRMAVIGSMGWGSKMVDQLTGIMGDLKVEYLEPVLCKGIPRDKDREALAGLAERIAGVWTTD